MYPRDPTKEEGERDGRDSWDSCLEELRGKAFLVDQKSNSRKQKKQKGGKGYNKNRSWGSSPLVDIAFNFLTSHPATAPSAY
jgi:hypothetical protein